MINRSLPTLIGETAAIASLLFIPSLVVAAEPLTDEQIAKALGQAPWGQVPLGTVLPFAGEES